MQKQYSLYPSFLTILLLMTSGELAAQETGIDDSTFVYPASYFSEFSPVTVNDMLDRIPGIDLILTADASSRFSRDGNRGLGSEEQILIDGKRMAGKANEARSQLERITADQVDYIEIVRGTSSDLDVQNGGQLVNIVLYESQSRSNISSELNATHFSDGTLEPGGSLAWSGQSGNWNYLLSGETSSGYSHTESYETSLHGDLSPNENIDLDRYREQTNYSFNSNLSYSPNDRDRIAINMLYQQNDPPQEVFRTFTDFNFDEPLIYYEREDIPSTADNWEVGGDYEHSFDSGSRFKLLFIVNQKTGDTTRERFHSDGPYGPETKELYLDSHSRYRERIVRSSYVMNLSESQGLEVGVEGAQTIQDSNLKYGLLTSLPGDPEWGGLTPIPLPNADSMVEEIRYEPFAIHNWQINPRMSLESSLVGEWSEIEQSGDLSNKRDFNYLKPKFDYRFDINSSLQFSTTLEKVVSQLSFGDFSRSTNDRDDDEDTVAGNPELEPEESWRAEIGLDYRLPNDGGAINAKYFYYDYENKIGKIDISLDEDNLQSTNGNVGPAAAYGLIANASLRLGFVGLPSALFTAAVTLQESEFDEDPFTPREHGFPPYDRGGFRLGFRHDVTAQSLSYGMNWSLLIKDGRRGFDVDSEFDFVRPDNVTAFVEKVWFGGLTYRLEANNLTDFEACGIRYRYDGYVADNDLKEVEQACATTGTSVSFKVRGTF